MYRLSCQIYLLNSWDFAVALEKSVTPKIVKSGLKDAGIFPFDAEIFIYDEGFISYHVNEVTYWSLLETKLRIVC